jgi:UDP-2,3-diacylglucosamine pyrophosphatase LpxH
MSFRFDAIVVSDLHLGAQNSRSEDFLRFLDTIETGHLIVAGDLFEDPWLRGLDRFDVRVLQALREFERVEWLCGNHDPPADWFAAVFGVDARNETVVDVAGRPYLVCHGHQPDTALDLPPVILKTADLIYHTCQWLDRSHRLARQLKRRSKRFTKSLERIRCWALAEATARSFAGVILGHTHSAEDVRLDDVHYLNCGCWTERPCGFVGVRDGKVRQYFWDSTMLSIDDRFDADCATVHTTLAA